MSAWLAKISGVYNELFQVIEYAGQVDEVSGALIDGEISKDYALRNGRYFILQARLSYKKTSSEIDCCLSQPKVKTEIFVKAARNLAQYIRTLRDQVRDIIEDTEATFSAAIAEDADTVRRLQLKRVEQFIILLNAENVLLNTQKLITKESHPQHSLFLAVISGNRAMTAMLSYLRDFVSGRLPTADIDASRLLVERELLKVEQAVNDGRQATLSWRVRISTMRLKTERDRHLMTVLSQIFDS